MDLLTHSFSLRRCCCGEFCHCALKIGSKLIKKRGDRSFADFRNFIYLFSNSLSRCNENGRQIAGAKIVFFFSRILWNLLSESGRLMTSLFEKRLNLITREKNQLETNQPSLSAHLNQFHQQKKMFIAFTLADLFFNFECLASLYRRDRQQHNFYVFLFINLHTPVHAYTREWERERSYYFILRLQKKP
jgi:hypothetical protein